MAAGTEYANKLEQWFQSTPGPVQDVLRPVFDPANNLLKAVAGDPDDLIRAGQRYVEVSQQILAIAEQQTTDRGMLSGAWEGLGYDAFTERAKDIEQKLEDIGEVTGRTQEVLEAAAKACVEGANLIIDIVTALIMFAITTLVIKAALAALTFGASMAAWVAEQIAAGAAALARIMQVVAKVATALQKIAAFFKQLAAVLDSVANLLNALRNILKGLDLLVKSTPLLSGARVATMAARGAAYAATNQGLLGGAVPTGVGQTVEAGRTVGDIVDAVDEVNEAAGR